MVSIASIDGNRIVKFTSVKATKRIAFFPALLAIVSVVFSGAIFGFFFAWAFSVMWGLDSSEPIVAISAMQAINVNVRNPIFALAFFGTPVLLILTTLVARLDGESLSARLFGLGVLVYVLGVIIPTFMVNVPLNETLASVEMPLEAVRAGEVWSAYSSSWKQSNVARTLASGLSLLLVGLAIFHMGRKSDS